MYLKKKKGEKKESGILTWHTPAPSEDEQMAVNEQLVLTGVRFFWGTAGSFRLIGERSCFCQLFCAPMSVGWFIV